MKRNQGVSSSHLSIVQRKHPFLCQKRQLRDAKGHFEKDVLTSQRSRYPCEFDKKLPQPEDSNLFFANHFSLIREGKN